MSRPKPSRFRDAGYPLSMRTTAGQMRHAERGLIVAWWRGFMIPVIVPLAEWLARWLP